MNQINNEHKELNREATWLKHMIKLGYTKFEPKCHQDIIDNFIQRICDSNAEYLYDNLGRTHLTETEIKSLLSDVNYGSTSAKFKRYTKRAQFTSEDGTPLSLKLISDKVCNNCYQVAIEIPSIENIGDNLLGSVRFDAMIFINGLPTVTLEFKQPHVGLSVAFDQIKDYKSRGKFYGLFDYTRVFVISNFVDTKYFANTKDISENFAFNWTDTNNNPVSILSDAVSNDTFSDHFLIPEHLHAYVRDFMIEGNSNKDESNIALRPYQVHAIKAVLNKIENSKDGGYIFHTTGSGKTITSFKTCKLALKNKHVDKVIMLVDRQDLDNQTKRAYEKYEPGSYAAANNTNMLKKQLLSDDNKVVIGTIQKMRELTDINRGRLTNKEREYLQSKKTVIVIDECHRSQGAKNTLAMRSVFDPKTNARYFGFTGTPIFEESTNEMALGETLTEKIDDVYKTTEAIFGDELHRYTVTEAVRDNNVLKLYTRWEKYPHKYEKLNPNRIRSVVLSIAASHNRYTNERMFGSILACDSQDMLKLYYDALCEYNANASDADKLTFTAIFSTESSDRDGNYETAFIDRVINDYNDTFKTNHNSLNVRAFKGDVQEKIRNHSKLRPLDIVLVVDMLLTGFDSPITNTLYTDKSLKMHNLIQAYSRVNRLAEDKSHGNVINFMQMDETNPDKEEVEAFKVYAGGTSGSGTLYKIVDFDVLIPKLEEDIENMNKLTPTQNDMVNLTNNQSVEIMIEAMRNIHTFLTDIQNASMHPDAPSVILGYSRKQIDEIRGIYNRNYSILKAFAKDAAKESGEDFSDKDWDLAPVTTATHVWDFKTLSKFIKNNIDDVKLIEKTLDEQGVGDEHKTAIKHTLRDIKENDKIDFEDAYANYIRKAKESEIVKYLTKYGCDEFIDDLMHHINNQNDKNITKSVSNYLDVIKVNNWSSNLITGPTIIATNKFSKELAKEIADINKRYDNIINK